MDFADVHAHLELIDAGKLKAAVARAEEAGVRSIITNGVDSATNRKALQLQEEFGIVKAALGIYPVNAAAMEYSAIDTELKFMKENKDLLAALGEIGLDYQETKDRKKQQDAFESQLELARQLRKPVIVHSRGAEQEVVETLLRSGNTEVILHAFHGSMKLVKKAADAGFCFSIPSNIIRSSHFQKMAELLPIENVLTETDAPYLGPEKDGYSEPAYVARTVAKIAELRRQPVQGVADAVYKSYRKMFRISDIEKLK